MFWSGQWWWLNIYGYTKKPLSFTLHFKRVNCMVFELYVDKTVNKKMEKKKQQKNKRVNRLSAGRAAHLRGHGSFVHLIPYVTLCISFLWLFLSCILYNKLVVTTKVISWLLWVVLAKYQTWGGSCGNPQIHNQVKQAKWVTWGPNSCNWCLRWGKSCRTESLTCGGYANAGSGVRIALNCWTRNSASKEMKVLRKNLEEILRSKHNINENAFDMLIGWLETSKERISVFEGMSVETSKAEKQRKKTKKRRGSGYPRTVRKWQKYTLNGNTRRRRQKEPEKIYEAIMTEKFLKINVRHQTTDSGGSENIKQGKCSKIPQLCVAYSNCRKVKRKKKSWKKEI